MNTGFWRRAAAPALVLSATGGLAWLTRASWWGVGAGALGGLIGALAADRAAVGRIRTLAAAVFAAGVLAAALGLLRALALVPVPGASPWPEVAAAARDAGFVWVLSAAGAFGVRFLGARFPALAVLPAAAMVAVVAALLAPHRAGSINRPFSVSDLAWIRGWPPMVVFSAAGVAAALVGAAALCGRRRGGPGAWANLLLLALLAGVALAFAPALGLFHFAVQDPLGLSGEPTPDPGSSPIGRARRIPGPSGEHSANRLGLLAPDGAGGQPAEMVPFQDDYRSDGAEVPVAVVVLRDDVEPTSGALYFRQVAFSVWNGRRLVRALAGAVDTDVFDGFSSVAVDRAGPAAGALRHEIAATMALLRDHVQPPVLANGERLELTDNPDPTLFRRTYQTRSAVLVAPFAQLLGRRPGDPAWDDSTLRAYLEVPEDPRYKRLAEDIARSLKPEVRVDPWARALAVGLWLQSNTQYSARSRHAAAEDPTASFLFGDRIGYCVHLAHAAAFLCRALGVPARVAAGYVYTARARAGGAALLLRAGDAHAWAEVHLGGVGWVALDPSPPSLDPPLPAPDLDLQRLLGELARPGGRRALTSVPHAWPRPTWRQAFAGLLGLGLVWAGAGYAVKGWRRLSVRVGRHDPAGRRAYRASLDRLAEVGLERRAGETREAFARRAGALAPTFARLTDAHLAARFGGRPVDTGEARRAAREVARQLGATAGPRRWAGLLAPWRWTRAR